MYKTFDIFFISFHSILIIFNLLGWIWRPLRKINLVTLIITGASWFILGIFYGIGYCPLTDWHWEVLHKLGKYDLPISYITYLVERLSGLETDAQTVDTCTVVFYFAALFVSAYVNFFKQQKKSSS